jgi:hypothetical protein
MGKTSAEAVALAALGLVTELSIALRRAGALGEADLDHVFDRAAEDQAAMGSAINLEASELLEQVRSAVKYVCVDPPTDANRP